MDTRSFLRRAFIGLVLILAGTLLLGINMNIFPEGIKQYLFTPKILLVFFGLVFITKRNHIFFGTILLVIATFLYLPLFTSIPIQFSKIFWPVLLILGGVFVITHRHNRKHCGPHHWKQSKWSKNCDSQSYKSKWDSQNFEKSESHENYIEDVVFFSGVEKIIDSKEFKGGSIVSFFGGLKLNLTNAELSEGLNKLEVVIGFGGCKLIIPSHWNVRVDAVSIFGGFVDKRIIISNEQKDKTLVIKGVAIFGGGEIISV